MSGVCVWAGEGGGAAGCRVRKRAPCAAAAGAAGSRGALLFGLSAMVAPLLHLLHKGPAALACSLSLSRAFFNGSLMLDGEQRRGRRGDPRRAPVYSHPLTRRRILSGERSPTHRAQTQIEPSCMR